jgi:hypothetical protein
VIIGIHAQARQRAARPCGAQGVFKRLLSPERFDRDVDATAVGEALDLGHRVAVVHVECDVGAHPPRDCETFTGRIDPDDERRAPELRANRGTQADGTLCEHRRRHPP